MLSGEYRILKYIYIHPSITKKKLGEKFKIVDIEVMYKRLSDFIDIEREERITLNDEYGNYIEKIKIVDTTIFYVNRNGMIYIQNKKLEFWKFFFPYSITTLIALLNIIVSFLNN